MLITEQSDRDKPIEVSPKSTHDVLMYSYTIIEPFTEYRILREFL